MYTAPVMTFTTRRVSEERPSRTLPWRTWAARAVAFVRFLLRRKAQHEEQDADDERRSQRTRLLKRILVILCSVLAAMFLLAGVVRALVGMQILSIKNIVFTAAAELPEDAYGHTNVLLLGTGDKDHDGIDLTDSMMVASIDPDRESIAILSIPRDLWVTEAKREHNGRINTLYRDIKIDLSDQRDMPRSQASVPALRQTAEEIGVLLGVDIHGVVKVDFSGFVQAVDEIGGVEVDVPYDIVDTTYPSAIPDTYETFRVSKGRHLFDGETALKYARSRHSTSDFGRSARQQQLLRALKEKVQQQGILTNPTTVVSLLAILGDHMETTFTSREMIALAELGTTANQANMISVQLHATPGYAGGFLYTPPRDAFGGAAVLLPNGGAEGWQRVRTFIRLVLGERWPYLAHADIRVRNAGAPSGSAGKLGNDLAEFGFTVSDISNAAASEEDEPTSYITSTAGKDITAFFSEMLQLEVRQAPDAPDMSGTGALSMGNVDKNAITIILGQEYAYIPLVTLLQPPHDPS